MTIREDDLPHMGFQTEHLHGGSVPTPAASTPPADEAAGGEVGGDELDLMYARARVVERGAPPATDGK